jgi:hypothetical protein
VIRKTGVGCSSSIGKEDSDIGLGHRKVPLSLSFFGALHTIESNSYPAFLHDLLYIFVHRSESESPEVMNQGKFPYQPIITPSPSLPSVITCLSRLSSLTPQPTC